MKTESQGGGNRRLPSATSRRGIKATAQILKRECVHQQSAAVGGGETTVGFGKNNKTWM